MADDLKPMLMKVLASKGEKKFFFAYGAGKRKDGKGDGELAVAGRKPKKADIEGALSDCKQVLEGFCWTGKGSDNGDTVYFQGKSTKLSGTVVAKMALTARRVAGRQYDFQIPSPEEEARAANLKEGEGGNEAPAAEAAPATPVDGKAEAATDNLELAYQARVKALTDDLKKAITSGTPAGNEAKLRFSESQLLSRKKDFAQAMALLKVVEEQIQLALAGTGADPTAKAAPAADPAAEWKKKYAEWLPAIKAAMAAKGPNAAGIAKLLAQATALSKPGGDMAQALAKLTECHALANGAAPDQVKDAAPTTVPGANGDEARWTTRRQAIEAPYLKALKQQPDKASQLRAVLAFADGKAEAKDFGKALLGLDKLETVMQAGAGTTNGADPAAEWKKKYAEWLPAIKAAMAAKGPNAAAIAKLLAQTTALSKPGGDMAQALAKLTECHALATGARVDGEGKDAAAATKTTGETDSEREYKEQLWKLNVDEVGPRIEAAIAAKGPNAAALAKLFAEATALSKPGGDMLQMLAKLKECRILLNSGAADGAAKGADSAAKAPADSDPAAQWKTKLAQWSPAIKKAITDKGPNAGAIAKRLAQATALSKPGGDMVQALAKLAECHALATSDKSAESATPKPQSANGSKVAFAKAKLQWEQAKKAVKQQLDGLQKTLLGEFSDPESTTAVKKLDRILQRFNEGLGDTLDDLYNAAVDKEPPLRDKADKIIARYLDYLANDFLVQHVQDNPFTKVIVQRILELPLNNLKTQLAAQ